MYTREHLIRICERSFVPDTLWCTRYTPAAQEQLGKCYSFLKAGCTFEPAEEPLLKVNSEFIWIRISSDIFYLPTEKRLEERPGKDWL